VKINTLLIENFRGISRLEARDLGDTVIIAGQNGSGKSCIFDAIRLLERFPKRLNRKIAGSGIHKRQRI
jgi:AAA15 family ATPase/GTPase